MSEAERITELEELWRALSAECLALREAAERSEAGRLVVFRAMEEARNALKFGNAAAALRIIEDALRE